MVEDSDFRSHELSPWWLRLIIIIVSAVVVYLLLWVCRGRWGAVWFGWQHPQLVNQLAGVYRQEQQSIDQKLVKFTTPEPSPSLVPSPTPSPKK